MWVAQMDFNHTSHGFLVDNIDETVEFYKRNLGYKVVRQSNTFAQMDTGGPIVLFFWEWKHLENHLGKEAMARVKHRVQSAIRFESPEALDKAYEKLKTMGVDFLVEPTDWEWSARATYFVDNEGYMWEMFCWNG